MTQRSCFPTLAVDPTAASKASLFANRLTRITTFAAFSLLACSSTTSCSRTQVALSTAALATAVVGTTVGVTLAVENSRHTLHGCVFSDADGLKLRTSDAKVYKLEGDAASIKVGDRVKFHGSKVKKTNGDSIGDQIFVVEKLSKDYGPCSVNVASSATSTHYSLERKSDERRP